MEGLGALSDPSGHDVPAWVAQDLTFGQMRLLFLLSKHGPSPVSRVAEWLSVGMPAASGVVDRIEIGGMRQEMVRRTTEVLSDEELADFARLVKTILERMRSRNA